MKDTVLKIIFSKDAKFTECEEMVKSLKNTHKSLILDIKVKREGLNKGNHHDGRLQL